MTPQFDPLNVCFCAKCKGRYTDEQLNAGLAALDSEGCEEEMIVLLNEQDQDDERYTRHFLAA